jgi:spermidine/putrescine transport system substrate-binding protein
MMPHRLPWYTRLFSWLGLALLYIPLLFVALMSFNANRHGQTWGGFTLKWYAQLTQNFAVQQATWNTLVVALGSTALSTLLGTLLAIGIYRTPWGRKARRTFDMVVNLPVVTPDILIAIALVGAFGALRALSPLFEPGLLTLVLGHATFQISFVTLVVQSRLANIGHEQIEAARDLYADTWSAWRRVLLPQLATSILAGALLAFALSLDDFIISFFVSGPTSQTLPLLIYGSLRRGVSPQIHALSTVIFTLTLFAMLAVALYDNASNSERPSARMVRAGVKVAGALFLTGFAAFLLFAQTHHATPATGKPPVTVLIYSEYIDPEMVEEFTRKTGYPLRLELYEAMEEMIGKLQASGTGQYDIIIASDVVIQQMVQLKLIAPIDSNRIPNRRNVAPRFRNPEFDPGNRYTWPYMWGTTGILYRDSTLDVNQTSWFTLLHPERSQGPFTLLDEGRSMLSIALMAAGHSANSQHAGAIREAAQLLLRAKSSKRCLGFDGSVAGKDKVLSGMAWAAIVFNGEAMAAMEEDTTLQYAIPQEGSFLWVDAMTLSANSPNPDGAYAFMNYILEAEAGAKLANYVMFSSPNAASLPLIDSAALHNTVIYPDSATMKRLVFLSDPGKAAPYYNEAWTIIKSR